MNAFFFRLGLNAKCQADRLNEDIFKTCREGVPQQNEQDDAWVGVLNSQSETARANPELSELPAEWEKNASYCC